MRRLIALILAALVVIALPACEKTPTCREAVDRWWATADDTWQPWAVAEGIERDLAQCLDLQDQAEGTDCMAAHVSWREWALGTVAGCEKGAPTCQEAVERWWAP